jgi:hypothetical protein
MKPERILEEQRITVKRGRTNSLGFEPAFNSYFDFYLSSKYVDPPLLHLEDVTFHLFLRKNLNDNNPEWKMPSYRQIQRKFRIGQGKLTAMMSRLERAKLLVKVSGVRTDGPNVTNDYVLGDPIPHVDEFLAVLAAGFFDPASESDAPPASKMDAPPASESDAPPASILDADQQTSIQHTSEEANYAVLWQNVQELLRQHVPAETFRLFIADIQLHTIEGDMATIRTPNAKAVDWLKAQMTKPICRLLTAETGEPVTAIRFVE